jgi:polysaccharide biosynthesis protein PslH
MIKVLDIVPYPYLPYYSGGQKSIAQFLEYLAKETDLTVAGTVTNDWSLAKNYRTLPLLKASFKRYLDQSLSRKLISEIRENNYKAIIWEHPYFDWLAHRVKKRTGVKTVIHNHNIEYRRFRSNGRWWWPVLKWYEKRSFRRADILFFISDEDRSFAIDEWNIDGRKCFTIPFGVTISAAPSDKKRNRENIESIHSIPAHEKILLFNGLLDYKPNLDALDVILNRINPFLLTRKDFHYKIIICGKRLPENMRDLKEYANKNIIYAGFVEDIDSYFKAADVFLNPVQSGGGIKTKMVESIAFGTTVVATESGAGGIIRNVCGSKLITVADNDWSGFADQVIKASKTETSTPPEYYETYYWGNIVKKAVKAISG